jgi:ubiquinone/menaquinone biosynthesis C-methylase UbiE
MMARIQPEEFRNWNERMISKYDPDAFHHHPNPFVRFVERKRVKAIFDLLKIRTEDRVLEVGCGAGNIMERSRSGQIFGVDISETILIKAKLKLKESAYLFRGDAQNLPCKNQVFTHVICSEVLEHLLDPAMALREMKRVVMERGIVVISIPNEACINRIKRLLIRLRLFHWLINRNGDYQTMPERMEDEWHLHAYPMRKWVDLFENYFRVTRLIRIPFCWLPLRYVIHLQVE